MNDADPRPGLLGRLRRRTLHRRRALLAVSAAAGVVAAALTAVLGDWWYALAVGWDATAIVFTTTVWASIWPMSAATTARRATGDDPTRPASDILTLCAAAASLGAVGLVLARARDVHGTEQGMLAALGLLSVAVSWLIVHTVFTLRYALLYYTDPVGGVDFNQEERPSYRDFAYLAMTIGMTYQVSDTNLKSTAVRATALRHALLSYLFGSLILATAINLIAGLGA